MHRCRVCVAQLGIGYECLAFICMYVVLIARASACQHAVYSASFVVPRLVHSKHRCVHQSAPARYTVCSVLNQRTCCGVGSVASFTRNGVVALHAHGASSFVPCCL
jgi:L-asparagine transporter-like permease